MGNHRFNRKITNQRSDDFHCRIQITGRHICIIFLCWENITSHAQFHHKYIGGIGMFTIPSHGWFPSPSSNVSTWRLFPQHVSNVDDEFPEGADDNKNVLGRCHLGLAKLGKIENDRNIIHSSSKTQQFAM